MRQSIQEKTKQILWKTGFKKFERIWSAESVHIPSNTLKAAFHKIYLVHSWILCLIYRISFSWMGMTSYWIRFWFVNKFFIICSKYYRFRWKFIEIYFTSKYIPFSFVQRCNFLIPSRSRAFWEEIMRLKWLWMNSSKWFLSLTYFVF